MRHFLNASIKCSCTNCNRKANEHDDDVDQLQEERKKKNLSQEEEKEKKVDDIAKAQEEEKKKKFEEDKKAIRHMTDEERDKLMADLQEQLDQLKKEMNPEENEKKQSKQASIEFIGVEPYHKITSSDNSLSGKPRKSKYEVLALEPYDNDSELGDSLLIRMGSTDDHTVGNSSGDKFLQSLGSVD